MKDNQKFGDSEPGTGKAVAKWLIDLRVAMVGGDNWGLGEGPTEDAVERLVIPCQKWNLCPFSCGDIQGRACGHVRWLSDAAARWFIGPKRFLPEGTYDAFSTTTTSTRSVPCSRMPMRLAAASETSMIRRFLAVYSPRSLMVTTTCCFVRRFVTFTFVPRGNERCAAVNCCRGKRSPLAVLRP
jgi:hypothetical protein